MIVKPQAKHHAFRSKLIDLLEEHQNELTAQEMLAIASQFVGQLIALQDQRSMTPQQVLDLVQGNIEIGNQQVVSGLAGAKPFGGKQ
jgi:hypothetical protein